ncbi:hypothetical protein, partial [Pseudomonas migulae]|uniref:hypothetical protein n=1 Tax=Pseudomonas migulae TaxID=78543 RepID=UPI001C3FCF02
FWGVCQKGLAVRAKPPAAVTAEMDMYTQKKMVDHQAAFASRLTHTIERHTSIETRPNFPQ